MVDPNPKTLRRRSNELRESAEREKGHNLDSAALLLFYAVECGLKAAYMIHNNLKSTADTRGNARSARDYGHNIDRLIGELRIPTSSIPNRPEIKFTHTKENGSFTILHEAWRYGEKIKDTQVVYDWLYSLTEWCRNNR